MVEQLRERRRLLAALLAVGVRRRTLGGALLVQTAVPVALGLGARDRGGRRSWRSLLLQIADEPVALDGWMILALTGAAAAVVVLVTALSLPVLLRAMRPDGPADRMSALIRPEAGEISVAICYLCDGLHNRRRRATLPPTDETASAVEEERGRSWGGSTE